MVKIEAYLRLIRLPILILIGFIQYAIRWLIIEPILTINGFELIMSTTQFALLVSSTALIAAGGYVINDYFDVKIDRVNKIKRIIIDKHIPRRVAMVLHVALTTLGMLIAGYLSWKLGMWRMIALFAFATITLWYYSTTLQHQFLVGNLAISLMAGFVPLIVGLFEIPLQNKAHPEIVEQLGYSIFNVPAYWVIGVSVTIFILTMAREITKDVIDFRGDRLFGSRTIPIRIGVKATKSILIGIYALFGALFSWVYFMYLSVHFGITTVFAVTIILIITQFILIFRARTKRHFLYSANLNNVITIILILSTYLIKVSIEHYFS